MGVVMATSRWLAAYARAARASDMFLGRPDHASLIAAGLFGEAGSVLSEVKKRQREEGAYPSYLDSLGEELGDCLWYFVRLADLHAHPLLRELSRELVRASRRPALASALELGAAVGRVIDSVGSHDDTALRLALADAWKALERVAGASHTSLQQAAPANLLKTQGRWPLGSGRPGWPRPSDYHTLFDSRMLREERLPRQLAVEFIERGSGRKQVILRC